MNTDFNSDENMSLSFEDILAKSTEESEEEIEVLDDPKKTAKDVLVDTSKEIKTKANEIKTNIQNEDIYENNTNIPIIKEKESSFKKMDKVLKVQIILVILWVVLTVSIYFFGYELFEPIIPIN